MHQFLTILGHRSNEFIGLVPSRKNLEAIRALKGNSAPAHSFFWGIAWKIGLTALSLYVPKLCLRHISQPCVSSCTCREVSWPDGSGFHEGKVGDAQFCGFVGIICFLIHANLDPPNSDSLEEKVGSMQTSKVSAAIRSVPSSGK